MNLRLLSVLFLGFWGACARAETILVRSGDHPTFTRLVLTMPVGTDWTLGQLGDGYGLRLGIADTTFDLGAVFARISRDRIADLSAADGTLRIGLACECHATAFLWQPGKLVVDVVAGPAPDERFAALLDDVPADAAAEPTSTADFPVVFATPQNPPEPAETAPTAPADLTDLERNLVESVARAASQGLLEPAVAASTAQVADHPQSGAPDDPADDTHAIATLDQTDMSPETASQGIATNPDPADAIAAALRGVPGITSQTSIDRDRPATPPAATLLTADACLPDSAVAVADWADDRAFAAQIAERHAALTEEFDLIPAGAAEALAKTYIHFGFGREALQALGLDGVRSQERNILAAMAALVDGDPDPQRLFADQLGCATDAAFWALLDRGTDSGNEIIDTGRIRRTYLSLPPPLAGHLGTRMAEIFASRGDAEAAGMLLDSAATALTTRPTDSVETAAEVAVLRGDEDAAIHQLTAMANDDARTTPTALLRLFALAATKDRPVDDGLMALADAMRFEHRGDSLATDLGLAQVAALIASDRFDDASGLTDDIAPQLDHGRLRDLHVAQAVALTGGASDATFLRIVLAGLPADIGADAENAVAARLLSLGFADRAAALIVGPAQFAAASARRYLRAEAAVAMQQPQAAITALSGMNDPRAARLRAAAQSQQGDFGTSLTSSLAAGEDDSNVTGLWRAGAWARLAGADDPLLQSTAEAMLTTGEPVGSPPSLAAGQSALAEAAATRELIDGLLGRFVIDPGATGAPGL